MESNYLVEIIFGLKFSILTGRQGEQRFDRLIDSMSVNCDGVLLSTGEFRFETEMQLHSGMCKGNCLHPMSALRTMSRREQFKAADLDVKPIADLDANPLFNADR